MKIKLNNEINIDLEKLLVSKLLIQANSGGGKSWLIRRLVEQAYGKVQIIILDPEGEFSTLREKFDFILAGKDGDTPADPKSAALLARKLLELEVSAIIDLYELHPQERKHFVRLFIDSMVNSPKNLHHDVLVILDEAHMFVPEKDQSEAAGAVIDLASRGRKRGFCAVLATQRISKLAKDAAAECNNKLIGRTSLDIDRKRAADELGITSKEDVLALRTLSPGEFFAFGPAISNEVIKVKVGGVITSVPKAGSLTKVSPPTEKIKKILGKLADLPAEAKKEAKTIEELKVEIRSLKAHRCPKVNSTGDIEKAVNMAVIANDRKWQTEINNLKQESKKFHNMIENIFKIAEKAMIDKPLVTEKKINVPVIRPIRYEFPRTREKWETFSMEESEEKPIKGGALRMLKVLVSRYPIELTKSQLATFSKLSPRSGTYGTYLGILRSQGMVESNGDLLKASQKGLEHIGEVPNPPQTTEEIIEMWKNNLTGGARRMFEVLVEANNSISKEELGERASISPTSGTFGTYLGILRSNGLVENENGGIKISSNLFI